MTGRSRAGGAAALVVALLLTSLGALLGLAGLAAPAGAMRPPVRQAQAAAMRLVAQTPTVERGGVFELRLSFEGVPADGSVQLVLHDRVRSRSELTASMEGNSLRSRLLRDVTTPISTLPTAPDGSRRAVLSFDPADPTGIRLSASGAYPLEVIARDASGERLAELVTHVIAEPAEDDESPPLSVAVLAQLGARPALQPDGSIDLAPRDVAAEIALAEVLAAADGVPATLSIVPETLDALASDPDEPEGSGAFAAAAEGRQVILRPYVETSLEALARARLDQQLDGLLARARLVLVDALGVEPDDATWIAEPDLGADGLAALDSLGVERAIVEPGQVEALRPGQVSLSLAKPFLLAPPDNDSDDDSDGSGSSPGAGAAATSGVVTFAVDERIDERLGSGEAPVVLGHHLLAELAVLWLEQPGVERGAVVPIDDDVPPVALQILMEGLDGSRMLEPTTVDELFERVELMLDAADSPIERALEPQDASEMTSGQAIAVHRTWNRLETFRGIVGLESPRTGPVVDHLLLSTAADLDDDEREAHLAAALSAMEEITGAVSASDRTTVTLTAREGTVPLTLRNASGIPVDVKIHLDSPKLEFPNGEVIDITLTEPTTRLELEVRTRASGAFPLEVEVTSPDGQLVLAGTRYTVQSTAVSGAGLVLSIGALLFLVVWWGRHWRKTRRSAKLVESDHPAARSPAPAAQ